LTLPKSQRPNYLDEVNINYPIIGNDHSRNGAAMFVSSKPIAQNYCTVFFLFRRLLAGEKVL
jgi:hypothetical protein